jgi:hypothetical protein
VHTVHDPRCPLPLELRAEFIHGPAPEVTALARDAGLVLVDVPQSHWLRGRGAHAVLRRRGDLRAARERHDGGRARERQARGARGAGEPLQVALVATRAPEHRYLRRWAATLGISDLLARALAEAGAPPRER